MKKIFKYLFITIPLLWLIIYFGNDFILLFQSGTPSQSIGTVKAGSLISGKRLPTSGKNFITCSRLSALLGRNSANDHVRDAVLDAYDSLSKALPEVMFVYGETSWPHGGRLWPHKTHENGLSVDFFVPVRNLKGETIQFPTSIFNKFGYGVDFDSLGRNDEMVIDFEAMALHLYYLGKTAQNHGLGIEVVIFDNQLQTLLLQTEHGQIIKQYMRFSKLQPWVRHDEHYHVDFVSLR
jgi:penicillin-insensitive murein endopeptidase